MYYTDTLKRELVDTNDYKLQPSLNERVIVDGHDYHTALYYGVKAKENQDKVPTLYWLPKFHKNPYKARIIADSSYCTTSELSKLLTSCLICVKNILSSIVKRYMRDPVKTYFGLLILDKLKARDFNATSLSSYDFSTLYTTLPHNLIKDKLIDLIETTFQKEGLVCNDRNDRNAFYLGKT